MAKTSSGLPTPVRRLLRLLVLTPLACGDGWVEIHGTIVSAADQRPLPGADIRLYFDWPNIDEISCDATGNEDAQKPQQSVRSNEEGKFQTEPIGYAGCQSRKRGLLCVSHAGFQTTRIEFNDRETDGILSEENAIIELEPE